MSNFDRLYALIKQVNNGVLPDANFLKSLCPVPAENLSTLEIPNKRPKVSDKKLEVSNERLKIFNEIKEYLTNIGLPKETYFARDPEEMEEKDLYKISFFSENFYIKNIEDIYYLCIGGWKENDKAYVYESDKALSGKYENIFISEYLVCLNTGEVWRVNNLDIKLDGDVWRMADLDLEIEFVNSSLEQFILSIACWHTFYPQFEKKYLEVDGDLGYIFDHYEMYDTFLNTMQALDAKAVEYELNHWRFMCDLSLY